MKRIFTSIVSVVLVIAMLFGMALPIFAVSEEEYICELRLIYAEDYAEAKQILADSEFRDYKLLNENLNEDTDKIGVWLAYKTTTDIEDAVTDISVMQMAGGYKLGNYREMIEETRSAYEAMSETYLKAVKYWRRALNADHFLAESAYRQLNFYTGLDEHDDELLGEALYRGVSAEELGIMFFEGNAYALSNIRSLLAMGVSYNEDGKHYLQKVEEEAERFAADPTVYEDEDYDDVAALILPTVTVLRDMFKSLEAYEEEMDYTDSEFTDRELEFVEHKALAEMTRRISYLGGKTLYQFCVEYQPDTSDYSSLYPLVAALNEGQLAMTQVAHYYDVVRYSMTDYPEDMILEELEKLEETYEEYPFDIYCGVDRSIYQGSFALTTAAYRANAYGEGDVLDALFGDGRWKSTALNVSLASVGGGFLYWAALRHGKESMQANEIIAQAKEALAALRAKLTTPLETMASQNIVDTGVKIGIQMGNDTAYVQTYEQLLDALIYKYHMASSSTLAKASVMDKYHIVVTKMGKSMTESDVGAVTRFTKKLKRTAGDDYVSKAEYVKTETATHTATMGLGTGLIYVAGGAMILYSAYSIIQTVYSYYNPAYEDVPIAMVNVVNTADGDRYIKYDVVYEAETRKGGGYSAGDLNAFEGKRWNALYYTKSYEAGKPLLADEFVVSHTNNRPKDNYASVHRFGENTCYNLNQYNHEDDTAIYLSVKQSKNQKSAVAEVPGVVGSMLGAGVVALAGGVGAVVGIGGTLATAGIVNKNKKKKAKADA